MPKRIFKITQGFVSQEFSEDGEFIGQSFIAGDEEEYEDYFGEPCDAPEGEMPAPFDMIQPSK